MKVTLVHQTGWRYKQVATSEDDQPCGKSPYGGHHRAEKMVTQSAGPMPDKQRSEELWNSIDRTAEAVCEYCGETFVVKSWSATTAPLYGEHLEQWRPLQPGDLFTADYYTPQLWGFEGNEIMWVLVLPNGDHWVLGSRASNCGSPCKVCGVRYRDHEGTNHKKKAADGHHYEDRDPTHRCWVISGEPPMFTSNKQGRTCDAGAGSIQMGDFHGFLTNGDISPC